MQRLEDNDLMKKIQESSIKKGIKLPFSVTRIYIRILDYAIANGEENDKGVFIRLSVREIAAVVKMSATTSEKAMKLLEESGLIVRERKNKSTGAYITTFIRDIYENA